MAGPLAGRSGWTLTEGHVGMAIQARAMADALGLQVTEKTISPPPWAWLPPGLTPAPLRFTGGDSLEPPYPELLISCGRRSVAPALAVKRASRRAGGPGTFLVHLQYPRVALNRFDVLVVPDHDGITGPNVINCLGSVHGLTAEHLAVQADAERARFADLPRPLVTVLVGGPSGAYAIGTAEIGALADRLSALRDATGCGLAVVPSRRTGSDSVQLLTAQLSGAGAYVWDGVEGNPYLALIGLADALIVTCDSVNMTCEAAASGKPVYVMMYPGSSARFDAFHAEMRARGHARMFEGAIDFAWRPEPLKEITAVAAEIASRYYAARG